MRIKSKGSLSGALAEDDGWKSPVSSPLINGRFGQLEVFAYFRWCPKSGDWFHGSIRTRPYGARETLYPDDGDPALCHKISSPDDPLFWSVQSSSAPVEWFPIASELRIQTAVPKRFHRGVIPHRVCEDSSLVSSQKRHSETLLIMIHILLL